MNGPIEFPAETVLRSWLADTDITFFSGDWSRGGVMELLPQEGWELSGSRYEAPFDGVRELRVNGSRHHVHLDFRRLTCARYVVTPSVCFGFKPSFELRLTDSAQAPLNTFAIGLALASPYSQAKGLRLEPVRRYLVRAMDQVRRFPGAVTISTDVGDAPHHEGPDWRCVHALMAEPDCATSSVQTSLITEPNRATRR